MCIGSHIVSSQIPEHNLSQCIADAEAVGVVNILGYNNLEVSISRDLFGVEIPVSGDGSESKDSLKWRLIQLLCCVNRDGQPVWGAPKAVSGVAISPILYNAASVPLIVILPGDEVGAFGSSDHTTWLLSELQEVLTTAGIPSWYQGLSPRGPPLMVLAVCGDGGHCSEAQLRSFMFHRFGFCTKFSFCLTPAFNDYQKVLQVLVESIHVESPWLHVEKLVFQARYKGTDTLTVADIQSMVESKVTDDNSLSNLVTAVVRHLETMGLLLAACPCVKTSDAGTADERKNSTDPPRISGQHHDHNNEEHLPLLLQPQSFSDCVAEIMNKGNIAHVEENGSLLPAARQYGLVPRQTVSESLKGSVVSTVLCLLHRTGTFLNTRLVGCDHTRCSERIYVTDCDTTVLGINAGSLLINARLCYLVPAFLPENRDPVLTGYLSTCPLVFRHPGPFRGDVPIPVFYQLVTYLMKHFPFFVKCCRYSAKFHVEPQHILDIEYLQHSIKAVMHVHTNDSMFLPVTARVCSSIRTMIASQLHVLNQTAHHVNNLQLQPAAVVPGSEGDYVDLIASNDLTLEHQLYSISGIDFDPPDDLYLWFGRLGRVWCM